MRDARRGQHARGDRRVNFFRHAPPAFDGERERRWRDVLAPYYDGFDITAEDIGDVPSRTPFDDAAASLVAELHPAVVSFHFGLPTESINVRAVCGCGTRR